jgi:hypothetical protein
MSVLGELDHTSMLWQSSKANPILPEATDCIQSTDYLHTKPHLLATLDSSDSELSLRVCVIAGPKEEDGCTPGSPTCPALQWERTWAENDGGIVPL